jgi:hypothetical protein
MPEPILMLTVEKDGGDEMLKLRPHREPIEAKHEKVHK